MHFLHANGQRRKGMFTAQQCKVRTPSSVARLLLMLATAMVLSVVSVSAENGERCSPAEALNGLWELDINLPRTGVLPEHLIILGNFDCDGNFLNSSNHPTIPI